MHSTTITEAETWKIDCREGADQVVVVVIVQDMLVATGRSVHVGCLNQLAKGCEGNIVLDELLLVRAVAVQLRKAKQLVRF